MGIGTFGTFTQARMGIYAAQTGIQVTGNNITNVNTAGYTRQRLHQVSINVSGSDRYVSKGGNIRVGVGALVDNISQIRSPYLDIRFRTENGKVGYNDSKLDGLDRVAMILDEVGKGDENKDEEGFGVLLQQLNNIFAAFNDLTSETGHQEFDLTVRERCSALVTTMHSYAASLEQLNEQMVNELHQNVDKVNGILTTIRSLNEEIRKSDIYGANSLELRDERNRQIDELSGLISINVSYSMETIAAGVEVEKLTIRLGNTNPNSDVKSDESLLVDGVYAGQISIEQVPQKNPEYADDILAEKREEIQRLLDKLDPADPNYATDKAELNKKKAALFPYSYDDPDNPGEKKYTDKLYHYTQTDGTTKETDDPYYYVEENGTVVPTKCKYLDKNGKPTDQSVTNGEPNEKNKEFGKDGDTVGAANDKNEDFKQYLKPNGDATSDPDEARQIDNPNYNIMISQLLNKNEDPHYQYTTFAPKTILAADLAATNIMNPETGKPYTAAEAAAAPADTATTVEALLAKKDRASVTYTDEEGNSIIATYWKVLKDDAANKPHPEPGDYEYYSQTYQKIQSVDVYLNDNDLNGAIQAQRELLTESGEFIDDAVSAVESAMSTDNTTGVTKYGTNSDPYRVGDKDAGSKRGIPYYQRALDLLAKQFADTFNDANQGFRTDPEGNYIMKDPATGKAVPVLTVPAINDGTAVGGEGEGSVSLNKNVKWADMNPNLLKALAEATGTLNADGSYKISGDVVVDAYLKGQKYNEDTKTFEPEDWNKSDARGIFDGGVLFSNNGAGDNPKDINASNISISHTWSLEHILVRDFTCPLGETEPASGASDNIRHFAFLNEAKLDYKANSLKGCEGAKDQIMFNGTFYEMMNQISDTLGQDQTKTGTLLDTHYENALEIDTNRDSLSAVDFNDEAMNLMMYSKAYNAACRLMTTIDSMIDKLVNGTGMTT